MKRTGRRKADDEDDECSVREILAELREGAVARRQNTRARIDRKRLEVWAAQDDEPMAFRPVLPGLTDLMRKAGANDLPRAGEGGLELLESTEPQKLPRETQKALALWTRYRLACLELTGGGRTGGA